MTQVLPSVTVRGSVIEPQALTFATGRFGTTINGQTFQYPAIVTCLGWQYATWFDAQHCLCVGRRHLPDGPWQTFAFADYRIDHTDVHNVAVIGICPLDGTIHLSFDHHCSNLHYRVSRPGVATKPDDVRWSAELFSPTTDQLVAGQPLARLTYPEFFNAPDGRLQLYYRLGRSGNGDSHLATYDPRAGGWATWGQFISGQGDYQSSPTRNAYHNGFDYDATGRLHTTWTWREGLDNSKQQLLNCHDLMYACSDDFGRTWHNNIGQTIGVTGQQPITHLSPDVTVRDLPYRWGMMNQLTQAVDQRGRVHSVMWQHPPDAPVQSADMDTWRYFHHWRDTDGRWHTRQLPFFGRKPTLHVAPNDNLYLVFNKGNTSNYEVEDVGGILHVASASASRWADWRIVWQSQQRFSGEPRVDPQRWATEGVLSVYVQEHPADPGKPSALHALDFQLAPVN